MVSGTHRSHHHALAKGLTPRTIMAELFGKVDGCSGGRGGSMHLVDARRHFLGSNGIVGAGLGLAMGAALAMHMRSQQAVAVGFFGDGGANTGRVWEFINLAALWKLPLIAVCENNLYAVETHISQAMAGDSVAARARALAGEGPTFIEALTYRYEGHSVGDVQNYREKSEVTAWLESRDPIDRLRQYLTVRELLDDAAFAAATARAQAVVADALEFAEASPWPDPADTEWPAPPARAGAR